MVWIDIAGYGIPACYSVVFFGAVTGAIAGSGWKKKLLLSSGGWVFFPCALHYSTFAFFHDLSCLNSLESTVLSTVFIVSVPTAILVNPLTILKCSRWIDALNSTIEQGVWLKRNTRACIAFLRYESANVSIILEMSDSMLNWFAEKEVCDFGLVKQGANWWELLGDRHPVPDIWKRRNQQCVEGMLSYRRQTEYWESGNVWFDYSIEPYDLKEKTYVVEFFDISEPQREIAKLKTEVADLMAQRDNLVEETKKKLTERLNAVEPQC
jgi:hypothetical protein